MKQLRRGLRRYVARAALEERPAAQRLADELLAAEAAFADRLPAVRRHPG